MARETYQAFQAKPLECINKDGELLNLNDKLEQLHSKFRILWELAEWECARNGIYRLLEDYLKFQDSHPEINSPNRIGDKLGVSIPKALLTEEFPNRTLGNSRWQDIYRAMVMTPIMSWAERVKVVQGTTDKYVSAGWRRTADATPPILSRKVSIGASTPQQTNVELGSSTFTWWFALNNEWVGFVFPLDLNRFGGAHRVTLPDVQENDRGELEFRFTAATAYRQGDVSDRYVVGVDLGVRRAATAAVWDSEVGEIVEPYLMSDRSLALERRIKSNVEQIRRLYAKYDRLRGYGRLGECSPVLVEIERKRGRNSRLRVELAKLIGQEIADVAARWGNAVVSFEDLSWVVNTMEHGRWNRGQVVKWTRHFVEQNGSRVLILNAAGSSQECHLCGEQVKHDKKERLVSCGCGLVVDRDLNAGGGMGKRAVKSVRKMIVTRKLAKSYRPGSNRVSVIPQKSLKFPGRDRSKNGPTPKRPKVSKSRIGTVVTGEVTSAFSGPHALMERYMGTGNTMTTVQRADEPKPHEDNAIIKNE